ncbi:tripartite tricarboxylate transporter TctB family protein [Propionivibrio dicarboxylicus]|uniref:Tripartite tricarboxylate transporter TctB family protein n=1 Tax=Propionivibrio dicarboxylicus TaxID=83767 RepID=A0A1G7Z8Q1_9RHOO|nr:tripartite tricarboxylate transporter TctB family protein [Propionivibrio dicarboxylicus]SDH04500.1 Tripartite tricarboxylate transporter TctB family protein [Propionivibrio dicarboxylicus]
MIRNKQNFASGVFFVVFGVFCALVARGYSLGTTDDIGAGYFPFWIAVLLTVLGAVLCVSSLAAKAEATEIGRLDWKSTAWIVGAVVLFAFLLQYLGIVLSVIVLVFVSSMGSHEFTWKGAVGSSGILAALVYLVFVKGLHLQFPAWPTLFS